MSMIIPEDFRIIAIICAYNEQDVIAQVIEHHIGQGVYVYLLNNNSTDNTVGIAKRYLGKGLLHIENFPQDAGFPEQNTKEFRLFDILTRKEQLAQQLNAHWFIHADADELRYSPWPDMTLREAIFYVHSKGYNTINHKNFHFVPTNNSFTPGAPLLQHLTHYQQRAWWVSPQQKIFKKPTGPMNLAMHGGHVQASEGTLLFPMRFLLLHFPLRTESAARTKIDTERGQRYSAEGLKRGWHTHYNHLKDGKGKVVYSPEDTGIVAFDLQKERLQILSEYSRETTLLEFLGNAPARDIKFDIARLMEWVNLSGYTGAPYSPAHITQAFKLCYELLAHLQNKETKADTTWTNRITPQIAPALSVIAQMLSAVQSLHQDAFSGRALATIQNHIYNTFHVQPPQ
jgi:hypothetical protein